MNWDHIRSNWEAVSDKIRITWGKLSDDDLAMISGQRDQLANLLQERYGYSPLVAQKKVDDFALRLKKL